MPRGDSGAQIKTGLVSMVKSEGPASLFKGFGVVALLSPLGNGLYFGSYAWAKRRLMREEGNAGGMSDDAAIMASGFFANTWAAVLWTPMDVVKQKQQALIAKPFASPLHGLAALWAQGGIRRGLMRGYMSGLATYGEPKTELCGCQQEPCMPSLLTTQMRPANT